MDRHRKARLGGEDVVEKTNTWGGLGSATVGAGYLVNEAVTVNADLVGTGLVGLEHIATEPDPLFASTFHFGVALGVSYAF